MTLILLLGFPHRGMASSGSQQQDVIIGKEKPLEIYRNQEYGFELSFPDRVSISTGGYDQGPPVPFSNKPVIFIGIGQGEDQTEGMLTVNFSDANRDQVQCSPPNNNASHQGYSGELRLNNSSNTKIGSLPLIRSDYSGTMIDGIERDYSVIKNGQCVIIRLSAYPGSCINSGCEDRRWSSETISSMIDELDSIAQSFRFIEN